MTVGTLMGRGVHPPQRPRMAVVGFVVTLLIACSGKDGGDTLGTVTAGDVSAEVLAGASFGVNVNGRAIVLHTSSADATCEDAVAYLRVGSADDNPEGVMPAGTCVVYVDVATGYDAAGFQASDDATRALVSVSCAMGDGAWVREERGEGDLDWYWSGDLWQGVPAAFDLSLSGGDEADFALTLTMDDYDGSFVYDTAQPDPDPASGAVSITTDVAWCPGIASAVGR